MATPSDIQAVWTTLLVDALASSGVAHVVLSPGSRSTPLVVALLDEPRIVIHDVIDERSAAFVALGIARASGTPAALVCTSGTALTHYHPAIAEASASAIPLVVLSANRPFAFQATGESQTIDQTKVFGSAVRFFADLGEPSARAFDLRAMRRVVAQAVATSSSLEPGPVHLDIRFQKPLEPPLVADAAHVELGRSLVVRPAPRFHEPSVRVTDEAVDVLVARIASAARPIVVVGARRSRAIAAPLAQLASKLAMPVFADPTSNLRFGEDAEAFCGATDALFRSREFLRRFSPDLVLQIGRAPVATGYASFAVERSPELVAIDAHRHLDPFALASEVFVGDEAELLERLLDRSGSEVSSERRAWCECVRALDARSFDMAASLVAGDEVSEGGIARALVSSLPEGARFFVANSLAVRVVDDFVSPTKRSIEVHSQRGASGIDGLVAGLVGAQLAEPKPSVLLVGDVSFLHDLGSLASLSTLRAPTVVLVVDNDGGRIFEQLPIATRMPEAMPHFVMSPSLDQVAAARAFGIEARALSSLDELRHELELALRRNSATLLRIAVDPLGTEARNRALFAAIDGAVAELP